MKIRTLRDRIDAAVALGLPVVELLAPQLYLTTRNSTLVHASASCTALRDCPTVTTLVVPGDLLAVQRCSDCLETLPLPARLEHRLLNALLFLEVELRRVPAPLGSPQRETQNIHMANLAGTVHLILAECPTSLVAAFSSPVQAFIARVTERVNTVTGGILAGPLTHVVAIPDFSLRRADYPPASNGRSLVAGVGHLVSDLTSQAGFALVTDAGRIFLERDYWSHTIVALQPGDDHALPVALAYLGADRTFSPVRINAAAAMITALTLSRAITAPVAC